MKFFQIIAIAGTAWVLSSCLGFEQGLNVVNSESMPETQITLGNVATQHLLTDTLAIDSTIHFQERNILEKDLREMLALTDRISRNKSDSVWSALSAKWEDFRQNHLNSNGLPVFKENASAGQTLNSPEINADWAKLNMRLLKFSGEVRFGDALEKMLYEPKTPVFTEKMLKSVIYTRIDDQIFINIFGTSGMNYQHTTGGVVKISQETDFPDSNEIKIKFDCSDIRYMDIYIRIPGWAENPTVAHGNVKYVPYAGKYCEISRKWKQGDEIEVSLKNPK